MKRWLVLVAACLAATWAVCGSAAAASLRLSQGGGAKFPDRAFRLSLSSDAKLTPSEISVTENRATVNDLSVEPAAQFGQSHFGTILVIDTSWSMKGRAIGDALSAAKTFIRVRNQQQPVGIVLFNALPQVIAPLTADTQRLESALDAVPQLHSETHIYDATNAALQMLNRAGVTGGSIVVLSDGQDTGSSVSAAGVTYAARARGVRVYTVGVRDRDFNGTTLKGLAASTKGVFLPVGSAALTKLYRGLGIELSNQYIIRYRSMAPLARDVRVTVSVPGYGSASTSYSTPSLPAAFAARPAKPTSFWSSTAGAILVSVIGALLIALVVVALATLRPSLQDRVGDYVTASPSDAEPVRQRTLVQRALGDPSARRLERTRWFTAVLEDIDVARIELSPMRIVLATMIGTIVLAWLLVAALSSPLAVVLALALPFGVRMLIKYLADRQRRLFDEQLPDNLAIVASALRAGHTFVGALSVVVEDAPEPSRRELRRALADEQLGVPLVDALANISVRMHSRDFHHVTLVATLQRDTGGNTAEVIDLVTDTIRERLDLRRLVRVLTAQGRLAGGILSFLPVALLIAISFINPSYINPLFHKTLGIIAISLAAIMVVGGALIIRRIVDIEV